MPDDRRDLTEHRLTKLEGQFAGLRETVSLRFDGLDQRAEARHAALMRELRQTRELAQEAQDLASQNQRTLDRVFWLIRQVRHLYWIVPIAGAAWMWVTGVISWDQLKAVLKVPGG